jgi:hypothetical protein
LKSWRLVGAAASIFILAGCASQVSTHTFLHGSRTAKPSGSLVDMYTNGVPNRAFERVAILDVQCESQFFATPNVRDAFPLFEQQARAAGCDAVIEIQEAKTPENWTLETKVKHYTGVGVAYK